MPFGLQQWFTENLYVALILAAMIEGMGLPLPAEVLFLAAAGPIEAGKASLGGVILAASVGNLIGAYFGFSIAYAGGPILFRRITRLLRIKEAGLRRVESFFERYGAGTVFLARFIGLIRVPAIYCAGALAMPPWRFGVYMFSAALIWNSAWAWLAYHFGKRLPEMLHEAVSHGAVWVVTLLALLVVGRFTLKWYYRRRNTVGP